MHGKVENSHRITIGKIYGRQATLRRPTHKLENDIKMYLKEVWRDGLGSGFTRSKDKTKNLQFLQKSTCFESKQIKQASFST
jgi:transcription antitermination factor NusA-like protein